MSRYDAVRALAPTPPPIALVSQLTVAQARRVCTELDDAYAVQTIALANNVTEAVVVRLAQATGRPYYRRSEDWLSRECPEAVDDDTYYGRRGENERPGYMPTLEEIAASAAEIREGWTDETRQARGEVHLNGVLCRQFLTPKAILEDKWPKRGRTFASPWVNRTAHDSGT